MNDGMPPEGGEPVGDRLSRLARFLDHTAGEIERLFRAKVAGEEPATQELKSELADLKRWAGLAFEEQVRIEKLIRTKAGESGGDGDGGYEIDFAEARASIGRRLDRLRAASGAGGVSQ